MYRRITEYIYSYENGQKICNCGYCRFDICDNQCKIFINIKVPDRYTMGIAEIYLLAENKTDGKLSKEMLGKTGGLNGTICYRQICDKNCMAGSIGMDNIKGVLIYNGESLKKAFYCNLKDDEPDLLSLEEAESDTNVNFTEGIEEIDDNDMGNIEYSDIVDWEHKSPLEDNNSINDMSDNENQADIIEENKQTEAFSPSVEENRQAEREINIANDSRDNEKCEEQEERENETKGGEKWQDILFSKFPKVRINFGGEESEAIKMRPHDLVWFPRKYWRFSNNRCLLNGYYNYRYIMLVKGMGERQGNYYLAVPGKNMVNEAISARKQGFSEFVTSKGDLGFWCCKVGQ